MHITKTSLYPIRQRLILIILVFFMLKISLIKRQFKIQRRDIHFLFE